MNVNGEALLDAARELEELLRKLLASEPDARICLRALSPFFNEIRAHSASEPYDWLPCSYHFHEGSLRRYRDLERAYSEFAVLARGIDRAPETKGPMT